MTRRERLERKVEKRADWAAGRRAKAASVYAFTDQFRGDHAFNTQPGHIPLRARVIRMEERAHEDAKMAGHHDSKAAGLAAQLERAVFSDDVDAVEQLAARILENEAKRDRMKAVNRLYRKGDAVGLAELGLSLDTLRSRLADPSIWDKQPHAGWEITNLGARIRADRDRIEDIRRRQQRTAAAEAAGGVVIEGDAWVRVTFAEKPAREILDALKAAGFRWGAGSWVGERAKLPAGVSA